MSFYDKGDNYLEKILDNIGEGIHVVDEEGRTLVYNKKMAELEELDKESVLGEKLLDVFPSLDENTSTLLQVLNSENAIIDQQQEYLNSYGHKIITINSTLPIKFEDGKTWAIEVAKDITEIKNLYNKINKLQERLYRKQDEPDIDCGFYTFSNIKGENKKLKKVIKYAKQASQTDSSVLIVGETGTGKELFAQSIHSASQRRNKPFIAQNCAALPEKLLEGILFGTRKGGFTGAINRKGLFEQANGGTLLLDEINSMSKGLQAKLLRALQEGAVRPIGGDRDVKVDVRIIATINTSPVEALREGRLREDLYYRLAVVLLYLPLLSDRKDDILLLSEYFIKRFNKKFGAAVRGLSERVKDIFCKYAWPGNVRQLEHVIEGAMNLMGAEMKIQEEHVEPYLIDIRDSSFRKREQASMENGSLPDRLDDIEKKMIMEALEDSDGNITKAARKLGIKRQSLQYRIDKYDLR